jgi:glycosyltransferase involved in cell wall biosynthesis
LYLSIVVPAYNEEARIDDSLRKLVAYLSGRDYAWEVLVADDGSTDATATLTEAHADGERVRLLRLPHKGKGAAVKAGMLQARGRYRMMCDADLAMPVEWIAEFVATMEQGLDIVIGSRQIAGARRFGEPRSRHMMGRLFNWCVRLVAVSDFEDTQCGFKCFSAEAAEKLFPLQRSSGFGFDVEVLYLASRAGLDMVEMPIDWYHQPNSKVRPLVDSALMLRDALAIRLNSLRGRY